MAVVVSIKKRKEEKERKKEGKRRKRERERTASDENWRRLCTSIHMHFHLSDRPSVSWWVERGARI